MIKLFLLSVVMFNAFLLFSQHDNYFNKMANSIARLEVYHNGEISHGNATFYDGGYFVKDTINTDSIVDKYINGEFYLVSNKHLLIPENTIPDSIVFHIRETSYTAPKDSTSRNFLVDIPYWHRSSFDKNYIKKNIIVHENLEVDIAIISIDKSIRGGWHNHEDSYKLFHYSLYPIRKTDLETDNNSPTPFIGDRVVVVGYPRNFYDQINFLPIAKSATIASFFGQSYNGLPKYLIDSKLYRSFSGSLVMYLPPEVFVSADGKMRFYKSRKPVQFIGIYSGEIYLDDTPIETDDAITIRKIKMDLGNVWYLNVIEEIINQN